MIPEARPPFLVRPRAKARAREALYRELACGAARL
jgi:hypothetical protein